MTRRFEGKSVLVTGAASGIGRETAIAFAREGARVVVSDTDPVAGESLVPVLREAGGEGLFVAADVSNERDVQRLVDAAVSAYGELDVAFNNAGIGGTLGPIASMSVDEFDRVIAVNLRGVFLCMRAELGAMQRRGGSIVNNASILGTVGFAGAGAYVASKHGVVGLTRVAAIEYAALGIRVNCVCPGFIETPMLGRAGLLSDSAARAGIEAMHPLNRLGRSEEVASAVLFLASRESSFVTGHPLLVDGGYVAR